MVDITLQQLSTSSEILHPVKARVRMDFGVRHYGIPVMRDPKSIVRMWIWDITIVTKASF